LRVRRFEAADNGRAQGVARSRRVDAGLTHFSQPRLILCGAHSYSSSSRATLPGHHCSELAAGATPRFRRLSFARHVDFSGSAWFPGERDRAVCGRMRRTSQ
jgi:hypothetical protein